VRVQPDAVTRVSGMGDARAAQVLAAVELGRRTLMHGPAHRVQFTTPRSAAEFLLPQHGNRPVEQFGVVLLDTRHRVIRTVVLSIGTLDASIVHPREVFREAALAGAAAIVVFHNHPSGDPAPSEDDTRLTVRLVGAGVMMGIPVIDHVILADTRYFSYREEGKF
jgi:DNA repair protein RadC